MYPWALILALTATGTAYAQTPAREADYTRAAALRATDPEAALTLYRALHADTGAPRAMAQIGLLEGQLGRWLLAEQHLVAALEASGDAWVEPRRRTLEATLAQVRAHLSDLTVTANVPGASLSVNGVAAGSLPLARPVRVAVGALVLDLDAAGHEHLRQSVEAVPGQTRVSVALVPIRRVTEVLAPQTFPPRPVVFVTAPTPHPEEPATSVARSPWLWVGIGALVVGGVLGGLAAGGVFTRTQPPLEGTAYNVTAIQF